MLLQSFYNQETAVYAAEELKKYLDRMDPGFCTGILYDSSCEGKKGEDTIQLGLLADFGLDTSEVMDPACDDVIHIDIQNGSGMIAGSNIRSILLSVYAYLRAAGCAFLRPGDDGEIIPQRNMKEFSFTYHKKADYPFRGECIEGAVSFEHICNTIIWSPKVGMNMFMLEQIIPYNYISRWYKHAGNTVLEDENVSFEQVGEYVKKLELLIKKCGLQLHSLGHGYLLEPYGIHYKTAADTYELNEEARQDIALVNGKRELFENSPNFTHLCYSRKDVRAKLIKFLVEYMQEKPYIDFLHVWLSDAINNQCECETCINERVSDLYVKLLNELDEEFTRLGIDTRIVFILYTDTHWAPLYEKIKNPDRFYMLTAITGRDYTKPYDNTPYEGETPPYVKNDYTIKPLFPLSMRFVEDWKTAFSGRMFIYEYHMYVQQYNDPGIMKLSKLWLDDIKSLESLNIHGMMEDQTQRSFFPNGLPMSVYAAGMFDKEIEFEPFAEQYFKDSYGLDYQLAMDYLQSISDLMGPDILKSRATIVELDGDLNNEKKIQSKVWVNNPQAQENFKKAMQLADAMKPKCEAHLTESHPTIRRSWELLYHHTTLCHMYADLLLAHSLGDLDRAVALYKELVNTFSPLEPELANEFDLFLFERSVQSKLEAKSYD